MSTQPTKTMDVVGVCNALVDLLVHVKDSDLERLSLAKGIMHLVDGEKQRELLNSLGPQKLTQELGGSTLNLIRLLAKMKQKTAFAGMIGKDDFGVAIRNRLKELGIHGKIYEHPAESTGSCVVLVSADGERTMNTHLGASRCYNATHLPLDEIKQSKILHFCGYQWDGEGQKRCIKEAVAVAKQSNTLVSFDVADPFVVANHRDEFQSLIRKDADIVFANREEAKLLFGNMPLEDVAHSIARAGSIAVIKLGADGAIIADHRRSETETVHIPPHPVEVVDTTGAGDTFAGGFLYGLLNEKPLEVCGRIAAILATDVISRVGVQFSETAIAEALQQ